MKKLFFNPFERFGGGISVLLALLIILVSAGLAALADIHFDGVLDLHSHPDRKVSFVTALLEVLVNWMSMALLVYISGLLLSPSSIRLIDVLGTQGMARFPSILQALISLLHLDHPMLRYIEFQYLKKGESVQLSMPDAAGFVFSLVVIIVAAVWMVALMYRAYVVACNLKGTKAVVSFVILLLLAEVMSKALIYLLAF